MRPSNPCDWIPSALSRIQRESNRIRLARNRIRPDPLNRSPRRPERPTCLRSGCRRCRRPVDGGVGQGGHPPSQHHAVGVPFNKRGHPPQKGTPTSKGDTHLKRGHPPQKGTPTSTKGDTHLAGPMWWVSHLQSWWVSPLHDLHGGCPICVVGVPFAINGCGCCLAGPAKIIFFDDFRLAHSVLHCTATDRKRA